MVFSRKYLGFGSSASAYELKIDLKKGTGHSRTVLLLKGISVLDSGRVKVQRCLFKKR